ncbi:pancreatic secretory granule membrane major glycoprotein GP2-like [Alosa alosa]|uniref:pancreatic secretory granule membrane major glycoprotein GP2-like n=1 Tax=Alosa alosa TaxID=278164 RepID=UPI002015558D|nr:pancreatic secretory granule membrane major glycoprotein GP2-like [Alosa alosa]
MGFAICVCVLSALMLMMGELSAAQGSAETSPEPTSTTTEETTVSVSTSAQRLLLEEEEGSTETSPEPTTAFDPCHHYTVLDNATRAANNTFNPYNYNYNYNQMDAALSWQGWYRMYYQGTDAHMPEYCVRAQRCGNYVPLWLNGTHPQVGKVL